MSNSSEEERGNQIYKVRKYFALALDPIHVGTGGYRIGRVDSTIVREPATGIPKIPGTTIEGCCRSYAYLKGVEGGILKPDENLPCAKGKPKNDAEQPCGKCVICVTFGFSKKDKSMQAMALFSDARIIFFPIATMIGPVWVTCPMVLRDAGIEEIVNNSEKCIPEPNEGTFILPENSKIKPPSGKLNFGWLLLNQQDKTDDSKTNTNNWCVCYGKKQIKLGNILKDSEVLSRIVIVPDDLFTTIVNSNLEVRTSVAIDPERGAVEEGALFTYEAIPRGTVFWFDVTYQNPKNFPALNGIKVKSWDGSEKVPDFDIVMTTVKEGLQLFEYLGVGGMGSRGFGRLKVLNLD